MILQLAFLMYFCAFQATGKVRFVQVDAIQEQLELGHIVLLSNLAYSAAGEVIY